MYNINKKEVEKRGRKHDSKEILGVKDEYLKQSLIKIQLNLKEFLESLSCYELSQYINGIDHFIKDNRHNPIYQSYSQGEILYCDFGSLNFGFEIAFPHPCVVLAETEAFILVAPCSSKKHGHNFHDILDGKKEDGFQVETGVVIDNIRWMSKGRVIASMGKVKENFLNKIKERFIHFLTMTMEDYLNYK